GVVNHRLVVIDEIEYRVIPVYKALFHEVVLPRAILRSGRDLHTGRREHSASRLKRAGLTELVVAERQPPVAVNIGAAKRDKFIEPIEHPISRLDNFVYIAEVETVNQLLVEEYNVLILEYVKRHRAARAVELTVDFGIVIPAGSPPWLIE